MGVVLGKNGANYNVVLSKNHKSRRSHMGINPNLILASSDFDPNYIIKERPGTLLLFENGTLTVSQGNIVFRYVYRDLAKIVDREWSFTRKLRNPEDGRVVEVCIALPSGRRMANLLADVKEKVGYEVKLMVYSKGKKFFISGIPMFPGAHPATNIVPFEAALHKDLCFVRAESEPSLSDTSKEVSLT
jgi:hypothetical protein